MKAIFTVLLLSTVLLGLSACGGTSTYFVDPDADLPYYEKVGVLDFTSLSTDRAAGIRMTNVFFTELLRTDFAQVVEPNQFAAAAARIRGSSNPTTPWSTADLLRLQEETQVQAVFIGLVRNYEMVQSGRSAYPMVSLEVRMVDTATGRMVWSASLTKREGPGIPLLNWGRAQTLPDLGARVCRDILRRLP